MALSTKVRSHPHLLHSWTEGQREKNGGLLVYILQSSEGEINRTFEREDEATVAEGLEARR